MQSQKAKTLAFVLFLLAAALFGASPVFADCGTPCFENNDDILNGQRQVMRVDDLIAADPFPNSYTNPTDTTLLNWFLPTENGGIAGPSQALTLAHVLLFVPEYSRAP